MAIRKKSFLKVVDELTQEILGYPIELHMIDDNVSCVAYSCSHIKKIIKSVEIHYILIGQDNSLEQGIRQSLRSKFLPLLDISFDLFVVLHEIGHTQTVCGLNYDKIQKEKEMFLKHAHYHLKPQTVARRYRQLTQETLADEYAYNWMIKNPERVEYYVEKFKRALM